MQLWTLSLSVLRHRGAVLSSEASPLALPYSLALYHLLRLLILLIFLFSPLSLLCLLLCWIISIHFSTFSSISPLQLQPIILSPFTEARTVYIIISCLYFMTSPLTTLGFFPPPSKCSKFISQHLIGLTNPGFLKYVVPFTMLCQNLTFPPVSGHSFVLSLSFIFIFLCFSSFLLHSGFKCEVFSCLHPWFSCFPFLGVASCAGLCCCVLAFSNRDEQGYSLVVVHRLLTAMAFIVEHRL